MSKELTAPGAYDARDGEARKWLLGVALLCNEPQDAGELNLRIEAMVPLLRGYEPSVLSDRTKQQAAEANPRGWFPAWGMIQRVLTAEWRRQVEWKRLSTPVLPPPPRAMPSPEEVERVRLAAARCREVLAGNLTMPGRDDDDMTPPARSFGPQADAESPPEGNPGGLDGLSGGDSW